MKAGTEEFQITFKLVFVSRQVVKHFLGVYLLNQHIQTKKSNVEGKVMSHKHKFTIHK